MLGTFLGAWGTSMNKVDKNPCPRAAYFLAEVTDDKRDEGVSARGGCRLHA